MNKTRDDLDLAVITDAAITGYLEDRQLTGAKPFAELSPAEKSRLRQVFLPVIWSAIPSVIEQLLPAPAETEEESAILASFEVPDTLEGLTQ